MANLLTRKPLVTKSHYYDKPSHEDYNRAFNQLTNDFKQRGLKKLVCSPMGCVRELDLFAENIVKFQHSAKSTVNIVTCDEKSHRFSRILNLWSYSATKLKNIKEKRFSQIIIQYHFITSPDDTLPPTSYLTVSTNQLEEEVEIILRLSHHTKNIYPTAIVNIIYSRQIMLVWIPLIMTQTLI